MKPIYSGKVREIYDVSDKQLVIVATDRISAFDSILPVQIKGKGKVLNQLSNFWFGKTRDIVPNHIIDDRIETMPSFFQKEYFSGRSVLVKKLNMLPYEFVVRGYLFGSMWEAYEKGESFCGVKLREGYRLAQKLEQLVCTPAIKHDRGHDEYVDMQEIENKLGCERTKKIVNYCFELYKTCSEYALSRGLIIADAKFEFGQDENGQLILADEIFTPDAGRFWDAENYKVGIFPESYDKQFLRDWLLANRVVGKFQFDKISQDVLLRTEQLYNVCLIRLIK